MCLLCESNILKDQDKFMIALDIPYINLYMHMGCYRQIQEDLNNFLLQHIEMVYNYNGEENNARKSNRIRRKERRTRKNE